jgi:hypothetical protein
LTGKTPGAGIPGPPETKITILDNNTKDLAVSMRALGHFHSGRAHFLLFNAP